MHDTLSACPGDFAGMMRGSDLFTLCAVPTIIASRTSNGGGPPAYRAVSINRYTVPR